MEAWIIVFWLEGTLLNLTPNPGDRFPTLAKCAYEVQRIANRTYKIRPLTGELQAKNGNKDGPLVTQTIVGDYYCMQLWAESQGAR